LEIDFFHTDDTFSIEYHTVPMDEVIANSDFLTLHVPAPKDGKAILGAAEFARMKTGVVIVNTARGGLVDEEALLQALESGKVGGAGLDVFVGEPTPDTRLLNHPRISVSPHIGGSTAEAQERIGIELAEAVAAQF
jgi:D-3-phosphoglycerate dehydrogenase